jgi:two-component system, OmpR family, phosphate regulon sensor histidine kinase PhoR
MAKPLFCTIPNSSFVFMKRIFPVIVVLISLSLLGIIALQISWFSNMKEVQIERFLDKVSEAGAQVAEEIGRDASTPSTNTPSSKSGYIKAGPDDYTLSYKPFTLSLVFTVTEVTQKINHALAQRGLKEAEYEFAITSGYDNFNIEMQSSRFLMRMLDTVSNRQILTPIIPKVSEQKGPLAAFEHLVIIVPNYKKQVWKSLTLMIIGSGLFTLIILAAFYLTVRTLIKQKKISEIKSDFINNMTHEFKTPLATISLAVDALKNEKVKTDPTKADYFTAIIKEENKRMNRHVETILQAALMDRQELKLNLQPLHVHEVIHRVLDNFKLQMQEKEASVVLRLDARKDLILADEIHFSNMMNNLIDNAVKYSEQGLKLEIASNSTPKGIVIKVQDNGIGMSKETMKRVFEKFYRAHTGNVHNVKGFGLGMSYVKSVIDALKGKIKVDSTLGRGTTFTLELPSAKEA